MKMRVALLSSMGLLLLAACAPQPAVTPTPTTSASTSAAAEAPEATASPTPTAAPDSANASDYLIPELGPGIFFLSPSSNLRCGVLMDPASGEPDIWSCSASEHSWEFAGDKAGDPCFEQPALCGEGIEGIAHQVPEVMLDRDATYVRDNYVGTGSVSKLLYGTSVTYAGITCSSAESGITCTDTLTGHGFTISQSLNVIY